MKKYLLIQLTIFAVFLIITGILMYDNKHILHLIPERGQNLKEGIFIGRLKVHGLYKKINQMYIFQNDTVRFDKLKEGDINFVYLGPALPTENAVKVLQDSLQSYIEHPERHVKKLNVIGIKE